MNQDKPSKVCPHCGTGRIYTGDYQRLNGRLDNGQQACVDCVVSERVQLFIERRAQ